ncbi:hypothetical protein CMV_009176 [Castanea mollissima]|uniref:Uncharacterized protein n=1 Tax=Castanea mollissima TaxID=60419 RepID=A0A8J4R627_9ROSI|nr:hypothetical protein CMV_009176 [Castanea mollissima]
MGVLNCIQFLSPFVAIYKHNDISIFLSVKKYRKRKNVEPLFKASKQKERVNTLEAIMFWTCKYSILPLTSVFGGWSNILLEEHGCQEAERAFQNHELESIYFALWAKIKRS